MSERQRANRERSAGVPHDRPKRSEDPGMSDWEEYLAAAQRLDAVRRAEASAATERDRVLHAAREELSGVRARLAPQRARLRELGALDEELRPGPADAGAAAQIVGSDPGAVLAALRQARVTADAADAALLGGGGPSPTGAQPPWLRNLLVYGPFAAVVFVVQLGLYLAVDDGSLPLYGAVCGLAMPAAAFVLGWAMIGLIFPPGPGGRVERTALVGAVVCFAPVLMLCVGAGALAVLR
jgi:hypothetical protein